MGRTLEDRQRALVEMLGAGSASDMKSGTLIVVPSLTFPQEELAKIAGIQFYEERLLFLLLLLARPDLRIVFVTSVRIEEPIVDYYLRFVPPEVRPGDRLWLRALWDPHARALTAKVLENAEALSRLRQLAEGDSCLVTFNVSLLEKQLSDEIGAPLYGCPPELVQLGSKSGSRQVAREAGVAVPRGAEDLYSLDDVSKALDELRVTSPAPPYAVVKLNEGFSGLGNAIVDLTGELPLEERPTVFCADGESWSSFEVKLAEQGGVVEELVRVPGMASPSVQMRIAPDGSFEVVSTHDQVLGGPDDQVYLGCRFPAQERYRAAIQEAGRHIARVLAARGVMGSFGVDFVIPPDEPVIPYLVEINLRMGGTTHPFLMTEFATHGTYDETTGELVVDGRSKCYVATDNLKSDAYIGVAPETLIRAIDDEGLAFDRVTNTGVLLHLLGALKKHGKVGMTCVADSHAEADELLARATAVLEELSGVPGRGD
ncbi:MAG TPA: peptide ligase PGM1-related protein [Actinomycetota bacterium]|nr:peptide ligase PGM1-related protein [Actinomycetota bacterium]